MTDATPRPWDTHYDDNGFFYIIADGAPSPYIAATGGEGETDKANAALIVRAVNNYDEALALLREAREELQTALSANAEHVSDAIDAFLKENSNG